MAWPPRQPTSAAASSRRPRPRPTSSSARSSTTSGPPSPCCSSPASTCSGSRGCGSRRPRRSSRCGGARGAACADGGDGRLLLAWGAVLAVMNSTFYLAIDRLPLGTVAAIEFLPVIVLAALGARTPAQPGRARPRGGRRLPAHRRRARRRPARRGLRLRQRRALRRLHRASATARPRTARSRASTCSGWRCSSPPWWPRRSARGPRCPPSPTRWRSRPGSASASRRRSSPTSPTSSRWRACRARPTRSWSRCCRRRRRSSASSCSPSCPARSRRSASRS